MITQKSEQISQKTDIDMEPVINTWSGNLSKNEEQERDNQHATELDASQPVGFSSRSRARIGKLQQKHMDGFTV